MGDYKLSEKAKEDLREIYRHGFYEYGEFQADSYYENLHNRFEKIAEQPHIYPAVDHIYDGYRRSVCGRHSIFYFVDLDSIKIVRILGRQDLSETLKKHSIR